MQQLEKTISHFKRYPKLLIGKTKKEKLPIHLIRLNNEDLPSFFEYSFQKYPAYWEDVGAKLKNILPNSEFKQNDVYKLYLINNADNQAQGVYIPLIQGLPQGYASLIPENSINDTSVNDDILLLSQYIYPHSINNGIGAQLQLNVAFLSLREGQPILGFTQADNSSALQLLQKTKNGLEKVMPIVFKQQLCNNNKWVKTTIEPNLLKQHTNEIQTPNLAYRFEKNKQLIDEIETKMSQLSLESIDKNIEQSHFQK